MQFEDYYYLVCHFHFHSLYGQSIQDQYTKPHSLFSSWEYPCTSSQPYPSLVSAPRPHLHLSSSLLGRYLSGLLYLAETPAATMYTQFVQHWRTQLETSKANLQIDGSSNLDGQVTCTQSVRPSDSLTLMTSHPSAIWSFDFSLMK